eukprot:gene10788-biopygen6537
MWRRAALCAMWAAPCGAVRRYVPCGQRRVARADAVCRVGSAVWRRAAPYCAVRRRVRRVCRVATRRAVRQGRAVWRAVWHAVWSFYFPASGPDLRLYWNPAPTKSRS